MPGPSEIAGHARRLATVAVPGIHAVLRSRLAPPMDPRGLAKLLASLGRHGIGPGIGFAGGAARHPDAIAVIDAAGEKRRESFRTMEESVVRKARALAEAGLTPGTPIGLLGRNSLAYVEAYAVLARLKADIVYLNTGFPRDEVDRICRAFGVRAVLVDRELADRVPPRLIGAVIDDDAWRLLGRARSGTGAALPGLALGPPASAGSGTEVGRHILLTSGTTGMPKGAPRTSTPLDSVVSLMSALPYRQRGVHVMAAPVFHAWGWLNHRLAGLLDTTEVMVARAEPAAILAAASQHRADVIVTTPVAVQRLAALDDEVIASYDLASLRAIAVSGAAIPAGVVTTIRRKYGDVLYSLYGSTEAGYIACAGPADFERDPASAGRVLPGVTVEVRDSTGVVAAGVVGHLWAGSAASFAGYLDGTDARRRGGLLETGDLGSIDGHGLLRITGRADDVIICGGENVHPAEVEEVLRRHPAIDDVAVVGIPDPEWGQVPIAFVVLRGEVDTEAILAWAATRLAPYQRPRQVTEITELPRNETGKVVRARLLE